MQNTSMSIIIKLLQRDEPFTMRNVEFHILDFTTIEIPCRLANSFALQIIFAHFAVLVKQSCKINTDYMRCHMHCHMYIVT